MRSNAFVNFLFLLIYRHRVKHSAIFIISTLIVALFSSVMLLSHAIQSEIDLTLAGQPDFIAQKIRSGKAVDTPVEWAEEFSEIRGVKVALPRVFGQYFYEPNGHYFTIVGIDLFDTQTTDALQKLVEGLDVKAFMSQNNMIIGSGVKRFLDQYHYFDHYEFRPPHGNREKVVIFDTFPEESDIVSNDMIIMEIDLAKQILGIDEEMSTDVILYVPNELERDNVMVKMILMHYDIRVIQKNEIEKAYTNLFNYKGGVFLLLYMIVLVTFVLILYQRYSMISSADKKEIGILRAVGWSIKDVIKLKVMESFLVALFAFGFGVFLAYLYVFMFNAPLLGSVFFGYSNLSADIKLGRTIDFGVLSMLFLFFIVPFIAAVLVPVWKIAVVDPVEAMK